MRKWLRRTGLVTGSLSVGLLSSLAAMPFLVGTYSGSVSEEPSLSFGMAVVVPGLTIAVSLAIAWKWELIGGSLLVLDSLVWLLVAWAFFYVPLQFCLPLLASGILFLVSWRIGGGYF